MASKAELEATKKRIMVNLHCTEEEAEDVMKWDKVIDSGGRTPYDLSPEEEKAAKKMANVREKERKTPTVYDFKPRERKKNPTKQAIISEIAKFLTENSENAVENLEILNAERMIGFTIGENRYEFTLVQKRRPKN